VKRPETSCGFECVVSPLDQLLSGAYCRAPVPLSVGFVLKRILDRSPAIIGSRWCILTELSAAFTLQQHEIWV
jgi:hypothetical protein